MGGCSASSPRFPRHRAAASLKPGRARSSHPACRRFPRHRAAASLKPLELRLAEVQDVGFPRHRAAASLKPAQWRGLADIVLFSAASGRGLIEAHPPPRTQPPPRPRFPRHRAAASLKLRQRDGASVIRDRFPRHRAAASLKRDRRLCRDLRRSEGFPRHRAAASLKRHRRPAPLDGRRSDVFRGIGPRPH